MRKAFTLIELLVVIAIIAILAAILFPVFAQAKAAAKSAASISNAKQTITASMIYSADYDDTAILVQSFLPTGLVCISGWPATNCMNTWATLIQPYMKNSELLVDPSGPGFNAYASLGRNYSIQLIPQYAYNDTALSPHKYLTPTAPKSLTSVNEPADTVMFTSTIAWRVETNPAYFGASYTGDYNWTTAGTMDPPAGYSIYSSQALNLQGWGVNFYWTEGFWGAPVITEAAGRLTGGVSQRAAGQIVTAFVDGHAKKQAAGYLAQGTNWSRTTANTAIVVNDLSKYKWDIQ